MADVAATATPPAAPPPPWHQGVEADVLGAWQNKGFDVSDPAKLVIDVTKSWKEAERHIGVPADRLLRLPQNADDPAAWKQVWEKLGAPKEAKDYDFAGVKYGDGSELEPDFVGALRSAFAQTNLTRTAATEVTKAVVKYLENQDKSEQTIAEASKMEQLAALDREWGAHKDANMLVALNGARRLGLSQDQLKSIEAAIGVDSTARIFHKIGLGSTEDTFRDGGARSAGNPTTVEAAQSRLNDMQADSAFRDRLLRGEPTAVRELNALHEQITGVSHAAELARLGMR